MATKGQSLRGIPSLFIVSLPRSLSSQIHEFCCAALRLQSPTWTSAGEIMNVDRWCLHAGQGPGGLKYILPQHVHAYRPAKDYLSQVYKPRGFAYKDVIQPFVVSEWLNDNPNVPVLKIRPNIAHVALAMMRKNWLYPTNASLRRGDFPSMMVSGLLQAEKAMEGIHGETVDYDDLIFGMDPLDRALSRLYPQSEVRPVTLVPGFDVYRAEVLSRRSTNDYRTLKRLELEMREAMDYRPAAVA